MSASVAAIRALKAGYDALPSASQSDLTLCLVRVDRHQLEADRTAYDVVREALDTPPTKGWARFRSQAWANDEPPCPGFDDAGPPLAAEWTIDEHTSAHLRGDPSPDGAGRLVRFTYAEKPAPGSDPQLPENEFAVLRQTVTVLRHPGPRNDREARTPQKVLTYRVYWGAPSDDPSAVRRLFYRFAGFDQQRLDIRPDRQEPRP